MCFIFGVLASSTLLFLGLVMEDKLAIATVFGIAVVCGLASVRYGDEFWRWLSRFKWWWWG